MTARRKAPDHPGGPARAAPLLKTKLFAPRLRCELLARPRLSGDERGPLESAVVLVCAPAGVGKTTLSALLCAALDAVYWKPIQTGTLEGSDRVTVMRLAGIGTDRTLDEVYKFVPPVSPDLAARWAGVEIDLERINLPTSLLNDWLIVEGLGGVLVPINQKQFMLDLMVKFKLPVILAARSGTGTINHTLLTLAALHAAELPVHGVVLIGDQNRENRETIERFGHVRVIGEVPRLPNLHRTALIQIFMNHFDRAAFSQ